MAAKNRLHTPAGERQGDSSPPAFPQFEPLARAIGRTRYLVLVAVIAVLIVALSLFLLGTVAALRGVGQAWAAVLSADFDVADLVEFLDLVSVMLKAVVFYLVGVGLYSLFIAPLNLAVALGVETLDDLETKVISVVIVIMAVTFLEHFIRWQNPLEILQYSAALALSVAALVLFQFYNHRARQDQKHDLAQERSKVELFGQHEEQPRSVESNNDSEQRGKRR